MHDDPEPEGCHCQTRALQPYDRYEKQAGYRRGDAPDQDSRNERQIPRDREAARSVSANPVKRPLAQGENARLSNKQLQAHRKDGAYECETEDMQPVGIVLDQRNGAEEGEPEEA